MTNFIINNLSNIICTIISSVIGGGIAISIHTKGAEESEIVNCAMNNLLDEFNKNKKILIKLKL
ncbi:hypothetical protein UT300005_20060 [Clostridium sp. CTA-5]